MAETLIITSVGTSLIFKKKSRTHINNDDIACTETMLNGTFTRQDNHYRELIGATDVIEALCKNIESEERSELLSAARRFHQSFLSLEPAHEIAKRGSGADETDELPAELSSLYLLFYPQTEGAYFLPSGLQGSKHGMILLASDTPQGVFCARCIADYIERRHEFNSLVEVRGIEIIEGLVGEKASAMQTQGISALIEKTIPYVENSSHEKIVLNVTGGYKATLPYLSILGLVYPKVDVIYLFESSNALVQFPKLPIDFDVIDWNNHRGIIKALLTRGKHPQLLDCLPANLRKLFDELPNLAEAVRKRVEEKEEGLSFFGSGRVLLELIEDEAVKGAVNRWLAQSQHIWHGDLIAEAVDHARGHAQRLQELAFQILAPVLRYQKGHNARPILAPKEIALLAYVLWIHDIGHSGRTVNLCDAEGRQEKPLFPIDISPFPSVVRGLHHYSAYLMLTNEEEWPWYFAPSVFNNDTNEGRTIATAVAVCYLYHRRKMDLLSEKDISDAEGFFESCLNTREVFKQPLMEFIRIHHPGLLSLKSDGSPFKWDLIVALQRIVDGCDVQRERAYVTELARRKKLLASREIQSECAKVESLLRVIRQQLLPGENAEYHQWIELIHDRKWLERYLAATRDLMVLQKDFTQRGIFGNPSMNLDALLRGIWRRREAGKATSIDILFEEYLGSLDRIVWKHSPLPHIQKHQKVDQVFITVNVPLVNPQTGAFEFWVNLIAGKDYQDRDLQTPEQLGEIFSEINGEYQKGGVEKVLGNHAIVLCGCRGHMSDGSIYARRWHDSVWVRTE